MVAAAGGLDGKPSNHEISAGSKIVKPRDFAMEGYSTGSGGARTIFE